MTLIPLLSQAQNAKNPILTYSSSIRSFSSNNSSTDSAHHSELIDRLCAKRMTSVSLNTLMDTGRGNLLTRHTSFSEEDLPKDASKIGTAATEKILRQVANFLHRELPIRFAHRIRDLENVPMMKDQASVKQVKEWYTMSMLELVAADKILTNESEAKFASLLENIYERHAGVLVTMARGAYELRDAVTKGKYGEHGKADFDEMQHMHEFLDRFYMSRIGIRVLIGQYLCLRQPPEQNFVGMINNKVSPAVIVQQAIDDATYMCERKYGEAPEVIIRRNNKEVTFSYVPAHIHYIMLELIKNAMRATVEFHGDDEDYPPIKVVIADSEENEDVVIKVSDEGGGIKRSNIPKIWSYLFTTADPAIQEGMVAFENQDHSIDSPLAGLGYGLPISRAYARFFGGDLSVMSMEGSGTDVFLHLNRIGNSTEPLPVN